MEMKIREKDGVFRMTLKSLANQELTVYREVSGGFTFELRETEEVNDVEFERVPLFKAEELKKVAAHEDEVKGAEEMENFTAKERELAEMLKRISEKEYVQKNLTQENAVKKTSNEDVEKEYARNNALFHKLSDLRREIAKEENVAPFLVFHDKALWGMVEKMPADLFTLSQISGVGKAKLEKYGVKFLTALHG